MPKESASPALDRLLRWQAAGGEWRVLDRSQEAVLVSLCRCDGGEEVDRFRSAEPALLTHLEGRTGSDD